MFDKEIVDSIKTAGVLLLVGDKFAFMVGPDQSCRRLGVVRLGGHIEEGESIANCIMREVMEEASVNIHIASSPVTYYKPNWDRTDYKAIDDTLLEIAPIIIVGNMYRATALYLAYTYEDLIPAAEAHGIILLGVQDIEDICSGAFTLGDFVMHGGVLLQREVMDFGLKLEAGPHLRFLRDLINKDNSIVTKFIQKKL